jgi:hypothetical protein
MGDYFILYEVVIGNVKEDLEEYPVYWAYVLGGGWRSFDIISL